MSSLLQYRPLFSVDVLHDFYLCSDSELFDGDSALQEKTLKHQDLYYQVDQYLSIMPTLDCVEQLQRYQMVFKPSARGFFIGTRVLALTDGYTPRIELDTPLCLRFVIGVKNPLFYNFTNLRVTGLSDSTDKSIYYFSNLNQNSSTKLYLSKPLPTAFTPNKPYTVGDIIIDKGFMFEAIEDIKPQATMIANYWKNIYKNLNAHLQFVTYADRLPFRSSRFEHLVSNENEKHEQLEVLIYDINGLLVQRKHYQTLEAGKPLTFCAIDLERAVPGLYRLEVKNKTGITIPAFDLSFYMDKQNYQQGAFAIIECYFNPNDDSNPYRWLEPGNNKKLRNPTYTIHWKNRATFWRYYLDKAQVPISPNSDVVNWKAGTTLADQKVLVTIGPRGLSYINTRIELVTGNQTLLSLLPNPELNSFVYEKGRLYSEVNMGGGLGPPKT